MSEVIVRDYLTFSENDSPSSLIGRYFDIPTLEDVHPASKDWIKDYLESDQCFIIINVDARLVYYKRIDGEEMHHMKGHPTRDTTIGLGLISTFLDNRKRRTFQFRKVPIPSRLDLI